MTSGFTTTSHISHLYWVWAQTKANCKQVTIFCLPFYQISAYDPLSLSLSLLDFTLDQPCWQSQTEEGESYFPQLASLAKFSSWLIFPPCLIVHLAWWSRAPYLSVDDSEKWMLRTDWLTAVLYSAAGCQLSPGQLGSASQPATCSAPAWYHNNNTTTQLTTKHYIKLFLSDGWAVVSYENERMLNWSTMLSEKLLTVTFVLGWPCQLGWEWSWSWIRNNALRLSSEYIYMEMDGWIWRTGDIIY